MLNNAAKIDSSFRDPAGAVYSLHNQIFRIINQSGQRDFFAFQATSIAQNLVEKRALIRSTVLKKSEITKLISHAELQLMLPREDEPIIVEHEPIFFPSYPYEWPAEMLYQAGELTIDIALKICESGFGLKDATPYNILFDGCNPIFIDLLSFEKRNSGDYVWLPYAQFVRTFILPLLVHRTFNIQLADIFLNRRDGIEPEEVFQSCNLFQKMVPPFLTNVSIPVWLTNHHNLDDNSIYRRKVAVTPEQAQFILQSLLNRLQRSFLKYKPKPQKSFWSHYLAANNYSNDQFLDKSTFVTNLLSKLKPKKVLDLGCNTGFFSLLAAKNGASVVAVDYDPVVIGELWRKANLDHLDLLPLVVNIARPTPATGWNNREGRSFLERAYGKFDLVLMLALIHHLMVSERIPLPEIIELAAAFTTNYLIIEYIDPEDTMFLRLTRGRDQIFSFLSRDFFEATCKRHFTIINSHFIEGSKRYLYLLRKKDHLI